MKNSLWKMFVALSILIFAGCATSLPPPEQRRVQLVENVKASKSTAYNKSLTYIAMTWGDSNAAIKMKDADSGQIIVKGNVTCNELRQTGDFSDYSLSFNLDLQAKDNKVRFQFEDLQMLNKDGQPTTWAYNQISSPEKVEAIKPCLKPVTRGLLNAIEGGENW